MDRVSGNVVVFVLVMIAVPWALIWLLRVTGRRWGTGSMVDPEEAAEPEKRPLRCRLNLFHRWRTLRTPVGERYQRCLDCGKTRDIPPITPI